MTLVTERYKEEEAPGFKGDKSAYTWKRLNFTKHYTDVRTREPRGRNKRKRLPSV